MKICFVCLGNICRSPTAEGVMRHLAKAAGREDIIAESAGIADYHVGERPDSRTVETAKRRGVALESRARHFTAADLDRYDLVLAMDKTHLAHLQKLASGRSTRARIEMFRAYDPLAAGDLDVPDPYYSDARVFEAVFDMCWRACESLLLATQK